MLAQFDEHRKGVEIEVMIEEYGKQRNQRVEQFIEHIRTEHRLFLEKVSPIS